MTIKAKFVGADLTSFERILFLATSRSPVETQPTKKALDGSPISRPGDRLTLLAESAGPSYDFSWSKRGQVGRAEKWSIEEVAFDGPN